MERYGTLGHDARRLERYLFVNILFNLKKFPFKKNFQLPEGCWILFFMQIFATFAFSILFSTLILYTTKSLTLNDRASTEIVSAFLALNYVLHLIGSYIGGRWFNYRNLFLIGTIAQIAGCFLLSFSEVNLFFWGLAVFLIGNGFNAVCINCMLTHLFLPDDQKRETAFLWNYSGMNLGFFAGYSLAGYFQIHFSFYTLFLLASLGSVIALIITILKWHQLHHSSNFTTSTPNTFLSIFTNLIPIAALIVLLHYLLKHAQFSNNLIIFIGLAMVVIVSILALKETEQMVQQKILAYLILSFAGLIFWTLYQLIPLALTLFIERNVNRQCWGLTIAPQWIQNINTIVIIIGGPILIKLFYFMRARGFQITIPLQFSIGLILSGFSFLLLFLGIKFSNANGLTNIAWVISSYIFQSFGELMISPIGYAMIGQLSPAAYQGLFMGIWLMITGIASSLSGHLTLLILEHDSFTNPLITNASFSHAFSLLGQAALTIGILLFLCSPFIKSLMHEKY